MKNTEQPFLVVSARTSARLSRAFEPAEQKNRTIEILTQGAEKVYLICRSRVTHGGFGNPILT
jgi:ABC-type molybdenum transport system ATPase subunit/photorepair protein PhrA